MTIMNGFGFPFTSSTVAMLKLATKFLPTPQAFDNAYRAGICGVEFWLDRQVLADWTSVLAMARGFPFYYVLHFPNQPDLEAEALTNAVSLYRGLGCQAMVIHEPQYDRYAEAILGLDASVRLAMENHGLDREGFERWAQRNRWLTLDVEHLWKYTLGDVPLDKLLEALEVFLGNHGEKLRHVHLPGYVPGGKEHNAMHHGAVMAAPVLTALARGGFSGLVVSEAALEQQDLGSLLEDVTFFEDWLKRRPW